MDAEASSSERSSHRAALREAWRRRRGLLAARRVSTEHRSMVGGGAQRRGAGRSTPVQQLRRQMTSRLLREIEHGGSGGLENPAKVREVVGRLVEQAVASHEAPPMNDAERGQAVDEMVAEITGLGPVDRLFRDPTVSDILVNGPFEVWVDRFGRLERTGVRFDDDEHLLRLLDRLAAVHGRHLDEGSPWVDVRMADGSRLHAVIPPLANSPVMSIRRSRPVAFRIEELYDAGTLSPAMGRFLQAAVATGLNILICGGAASGKTTFLNVLSEFIPERERVVTIEETAELRLQHPHVVALEARLPNIEGRGEVTLRTLVKNALRMRADRIIIGEVRGGEVFDMLQAMNIGHQGSLTTVHANSPEDALRRLENLVLMGGFELPSRAIRELLAAALQLVVHTTRFPNGARRITAIREVELSENGLTSREIFGYDGQEHRFSGHRPRFLDRLLEGGWSPDAAAPPASGPAEP